MISIYPSISSDELKGLIGVVNIIDVREEYLYRLGNIPTSVNIPSKYLEIMPDKFLNKDKKYYLYCAYGLNTPKLCQMLKEKGYQVINVLEGYDGYLGK